MNFVGLSVAGLHVTCLQLKRVEHATTHRTVKRKTSLYAFPFITGLHHDASTCSAADSRGRHLKHRKTRSKASFLSLQPSTAYGRGQVSSYSLQLCVTTPHLHTTDDISNLIKGVIPFNPFAPLLELNTYC
jgi:hypothetical protein